MNEVLQGKGLVEIAEDRTWVKGPLAEDWHRNAQAFAARIPVQV